MNESQHSRTRATICFVGAVIIAAFSKPSDAYLQWGLIIGLAGLAVVFGVAAIIFAEKR